MVLKATILAVDDQEFNQVTLSSFQEQAIEKLIIDAEIRSDSIFEQDASLEIRFEEIIAALEHS